MQFNHTIYTVQESEKFAKNIVGSNQKGVLFVYLLNDKDHLDFLYKIISAINFTKDDVLLMHCQENTNIHLIPYLKENEISSVVILGMDPIKLCINVESNMYNPFTINGIQFLIGDALSSIATQKELKKNLWIGLKELFGV